MRILVCVKRVPITGGRMVLTDDAQAIETRHLGFTISPARGVRGRGGGPDRRGARRRGRRADARPGGGGGAAPRLHGDRRRPRHPSREREEWDAQATAEAIVEAIRGEEPFDLIVFGNESADAGNYQVGIRVAYALGLPVVNGLKGMAVEDGRARCEQEVPGGRDVYDVPLPAVVTVKEGLNLPRYPSVPAKLRAKSKPLASRPVERPSRSSRSCASSCRGAPASRPRCSVRARPRRRASSR